LNPGWYIHKEGTQPAVRRVTDQLDAERIAIRKALGYAAPHFPLADHYDDARDEWMYGNSSHERLVESGDWREELDLESHRYMLEDVAIGLSFLTSVGRYASVPTPVADALLSLGRTICKTNFLTTRGLEQFDLHTLERAVLRRHLHEGFK
ncbi:MAG: NAD/NADP octopine/nopaline dehydrogenase family protein, partial [Pseudomonadota bacterium]